MPTLCLNAYSQQSNTEEAIMEMLDQIKGKVPTLPFAFGCVFCGPDHDLKKILEEVSSFLGSEMMIGCSTAGEFTEKGHFHNGVVSFFVFSDEMRMQKVVSKGMNSNLFGVVRDLTKDFKNFRESSIALGYSYGSTFILTDGMSIEGEALISLLRTRTHIQHQFFGGASGDEGRFQKTSVGDVHKVDSDVVAAIHIYSKKPFGIGVNHGLKENSPIMHVTKAEQNEIITIDDKPAFEVYKEYAKTKGVELTEENASEFFIKNEIGIYQHGEIVKARAPLYVSERKGVVCAGIVLENVGIAILDSDKDSLIQAARKAAEEAKQQGEFSEYSGILVFDCICREAILQNQFSEEIKVINEYFGDIPITGFLTYGEIARYGGSLSGWHNTTAVVVAVPK